MEVQNFSLLQQTETLTDPAFNFEPLGQYLFDEPDTVKNIRYKRRINGIQLKSVSLTKLIEWVTHDIYIRENLQRRLTILMTIRFLCQPEPILKLLMQRFFIPLPPNLSPAQTMNFVAKKATLIKQEVLAFLRTWIDDFDFDFHDDNELQSLFLGTLQYLRAKSTGPFQWVQGAVLDIKRIFHRKVMNSRKATTLIYPAPLEAHSIYSFDTKKLSQQFCFLAHQLFRNIHCRELLYIDKDEKVKRELAPNLQHHTDYSNQLSLWVEYQLLNNLTSKADLLTRVNFFLDLLQDLYSRKNYCSVFDIYNGVIKIFNKELLLKTEIDKLHRKLLDELTGLFYSDQEHKEIRATIEKTLDCTPHIIFYTGRLIHLKSYIKMTQVSQRVSIKEMTGLAELLHSIRKIQYLPTKMRLKSEDRALQGYLRNITPKVDFGMIRKVLVGAQELLEGE